MKNLAHPGGFVKTMITATAALSLIALTATPAIAKPFQSLPELTIGLKQF
jgi:hypothetical protein